MKKSTNIKNILGKVHQTCLNLKILTVGIIILVLHYVVIILRRVIQKRIYQYLC